MPALPGSEPPSAVAALMREVGAVIELTSLFIGSSAARRAATADGVRYLAMPGVRLDTFRDDGPLAVDFDPIRGDAERIGDAWGAASTFRLTHAGRAPTCVVRSQGGPGGCSTVSRARTARTWRRPTSRRGRRRSRPRAPASSVVDADLLFMGQGPLPSPVVIHVDDGAMVGVEGAEAGRLEEMLARCDDERMANLAEVSMAFNPSGRVCGVAMETESALGTAHIALGNSIAYGGTVDAIAHLDCVMKDATLELDGRP